MKKQMKTTMMTSVEEEDSVAVEVEDEEQEDLWSSIVARETQAAEIC
jgi:hypothetical protein